MDGAGFGCGVVAATVGDTAFTGSPFRKAIACESWKSSLEPSSVGLISAGLAPGWTGLRWAAAMHPV